MGTWLWFLIFFFLISFIFYLKDTIFTNFLITVTDTYIKIWDVEF